MKVMYIVFIYCTVQKKHMIFIDWRTENRSIPALLILQGPD